MQRLAEGREVDLRGRFLAVDYPLLLHVEGDDGEFGDAWLPCHIAQDREQRVGIEGLQGGGKRVLRREIHHYLDVERVRRRLARGDGGLFLEKLGIRRLHGAGGNIEGDLLV